MSAPRVHEGKLAIVTGSARGIGAYIARNLASKGANILINYATPASDAALASELAAANEVTGVPCSADISTQDGCAAIVAACQAAFSSASQPLQIDFLVHNAATLYLGPLEAVTPDDFHRSMAVNVLGPTLLTAACTPFLPTDRSGRVVVVSSINPKVGTPNTSLYSAAKGALEALTRVWCRELSERCTVNTIRLAFRGTHNPGPVMTDMYHDAPDEVKRGLALWNPLTPLVAVRETDSPAVGKLGEKYGGWAAYPEEVAGLVGMICSLESGWMTGSLVSANGGLTFSY